MDFSRLLFLISVVITASQYSVIVKTQCVDSNDVEFLNLLEGEAYYFVPILLGKSYPSDDKFTWYKNTKRIEQISTDKNENVHFQDDALIFLNLRPEDSGFYNCRHETEKSCNFYLLELEVFKEKEDTALLFGEIKNSDLNKEIPCPETVSYICEKMKGDFSWKKDFKLLQGSAQQYQWVFNANKEDEGVYTCTCTWMYNQKKYMSSGSRRLVLEEKVVHSKPEITSPTEAEVFADEGTEIKLNCSVFCGINVENKCQARWHRNGILLKNTQGYNQHNKIVNEKPSFKTIATEVLTIEKVSAKDFQSEFKCMGQGFFNSISKTLTLKRRESIIPMVFGGLSALLFCVLAAVLVKHFYVDLVLLFRPYFPMRNNYKDARAYDAYVVYQTENMDKATEKTLWQFITETLPSVLEDKYGYRLFIHGRDDLPGEDSLELIEDSIEQSKRLMVIFTPRSGSGSEITEKHPASNLNSAIEGFDCQVGLHRVLVQMKMSVIFIQVGETEHKGYTHLPLGLQHLIRNSAPIRWKERSQGVTVRNSRFWKRVRYLMPANPTRKQEII